MNHRLFIAVNLPQEIKNKLLAYQKFWPELPVRWTKQENLHITLVFLGYIKNEELLNIFEITKKVAQQTKPFFINLTKICYGPQNKKVPRMIWAQGEKSKELAILQKNLENALSGKILNFEKENRTYTPHITLGRIKRWEFRRMEKEEIPQIDEQISLNFEVNSIEVMESKLKPKGPDYFVLESFPFSTG